MIRTPLRNTPKIWNTTNIPNLEGKTALITGSNSGRVYYFGK